MKGLEILNLFITVVALCLAIFTAFVPYEWICKFISAYLPSGKKCHLRHGIIVLLSLGLFLLASVASKQFQFKDTFSMEAVAY